MITTTTYLDHHHTYYRVMFIVIPTLPWPLPYTKMTAISIHCHVHHHTTTYRDHHRICTQTSSSSHYIIMTTTVYQDDHQTYYRVMFIIIRTLYQDEPHIIYSGSSSSSHYTIMTTTVYQDDHQTYTGSGSLSHIQRHDHHHNYTKMTTIPVHCQVHCHTTLRWSPPYTRMATIPKHGQVRHNTYNMMTNTIYQNDHHTYTLSSLSSRYTIMVITV